MVESVELQVKAAETVQAVKVEKVQINEIRKTDEWLNPNKIFGCITLSIWSRGDQRSCILEDLWGDVE